MTIKSFGHLFVLMAILWPNIYCDNIYENTLINDKSEKVLPQENNRQGSSLIAKLIKENICRKKLNTLVRQLCKPYLKAERRMFCENMFAMKSLSKIDRKICRKNFGFFVGDSMRRRSISRMIKSCCKESCSVSTLTKYCKPSTSLVPQMPFSEDRDAIFGLKLPLFKPPENIGQYV